MEGNPKLKIGELLVQEGYITEQQLEDAIEKQRKKTVYMPLGEICVQLKFISKNELQQILRRHKKRLHLGELLVNMALLTYEEIEHALEVQRIEGRKLGKILIELGYITEQNLIDTLSVQLGIPKIMPDASLIDPNVLKGVSKPFLQKNECIPVFRNGNVLTVIMYDPLCEETINTLENVYKCKIEPAIASSEDIQKGIKMVFDDLRMIAPTTEDKTVKSARKHLIIGDTYPSERVEDSIINTVNFIISQAIQERATDVHIEPLEHILRVRYRIDGVLRHKTDVPLFMAPTLASHIKALCGLDIADRRRHQDGRVGARIMNKGYDLRVSTYASIHGESLAIRILPSQSSLMELEMLGFSPAVLTLYKKILEIPSGIIMVTGPSGCGKTTTLYASIKYLNNMAKKIVTVEEPIEYTIEGVIQGQISEKADLLYVNFIKSMLRQDPDVIMVGEIRDKASAEAVIETALTGHKVLTSFHTDDTTGALLRMFKIGIETFLISSTVVSVMSQRLVKTLCPVCKEPYIPGDNILSSFNSIRPINPSHIFYTARGCSECDNIGFRGRTAISEILVVNNTIRDALLHRLSSSDIRTVARRSAGLISMREDGFYKATKGITTLEEVLCSVSYNESDEQFQRSSDEVIALCERG